MKKVRKALSLLLALCMVFVLAQPALAYSQVKYGSSGSDVRTMQTMLNAVMNAGLTVDGKFGPASQAAVKSYQGSKGLGKDGICGPKTWAALEADYKKHQDALKNSGSNTGTTSNTTTTTTTKTHAQVQSGSKGAEVKTLQTYLNKLINAGLDTDGIFGAKTKSAVITYQKKKGLSADGICGPNTWAALEKDMNPTANTETNKKPAQQAASTLKISSEGSYKPGKLQLFTPYSISGTISSNYKLTNVTAGIYKSNGSATNYVKSVNPSAYNYNIYGMDSAMKFRELSEGNYIFKVTAKDSSMTSAKTLVNHAFSVVNEKITGPYEKMALATYEDQSGVKDGCLKTSVSMLIRHKLYMEGKSYSHVTKKVVSDVYNNGQNRLYYDTVCTNANQLSGASGTLTNKAGKGSASNNITYLKQLLKSRPEGVVIYLEGKNPETDKVKNSHAVIICNYDDTTGKFMVSDPGNSSMKYVTLDKSSICDPKIYKWFGGSVESAMSHIVRIYFYV